MKVGATAASLEDVTEKNVKVTAYPERCSAARLGVH